jgi:c-di-GMP-binding flagellar brake protein YcgR
VHANVPVRVSGSGSKPLTTRTNDLSLGGLQICCDRASTASLHPDPAALLRGDNSAPPKEVTLLLTIDGQTLRVNARGEVAHLSLLPNSSKAKEVAVGLRFVDFEQGSRESLLRFIEYHMRPAGV